MGIEWKPPKEAIEIPLPAALFDAWDIALREFSIKHKFALQKNEYLFDQGIEHFAWREAVFTRRTE
jgi:hypothetical protein